MYYTLLTSFIYSASFQFQISDLLLKMPTINNNGECSSLTWLTFMNSSCLSEDKIRQEFNEFGDVAECDGAIGGPEDGWVLVAMMKQNAEIALVTLKQRKDSKVGSTLQIINSE